METYEELERKMVSAVGRKRTDEIREMAKEVSERPVKMRTFFVSYLAEIYYPDGSEELSNRSTTVDIPEYVQSENGGVEETWVKLCIKLEEAIGKQRGHCVNYIQDAERRNQNGEK